MMDDYQYEDAKKEATKALKRSQICLDLINRIGTVSKKDGSHFAAIERNFTNCVMIRSPYAKERYQKELYIRQCDEIAGSVSVDICLYSYAEERALTFEEVIESIEKMKANYEAKIKQCQDELTHFDEYWKNAKEETNAFLSNCEKRQSNAPHIQVAVARALKWEVL